jgi:hypothetical protein
VSPLRWKLALPAGVGIEVAGLRLLFTTTPPFAPAAPVWMCARVMLLVGVRPVTVNAKSNVPPVIALLASRVGVNVTVAVPVPPDSGPVIAGTSFAARKSATKTSGAFDGAAGLLSSSHATAPIAHAASKSTPHRFIVPPV